MKWVLLATAPDQLTAEMWRELLNREGVPAVIRASDTTSFLGVSPFPCRIMVPEGREGEAKAILEKRLGRQL
jgi:hypothetical protein